MTSSPSAQPPSTSGPGSDAGALGGQAGVARGRAGGAVVGYIVTERPAQRWVSTGRPEAGVSLVGVLPQHRGRSLCSALIGHSVAAASASGMPRIGIEVDTRNPSNAHAIYEHLGFVDDAAEVFYVIDQ